MLSEVSSRRLTSPPAHLLSSSQLRSLNKSKYWKCNITSSSFLDVPAPACRKTLPRESEVVVEALKDYGGTDLIGNEGGEEYKPEWLGGLESSVFGFVCSGGEGGEGEGEWWGCGFLGGVFFSFGIDSNKLFIFIQWTIQRGWTIY